MHVANKTYYVVGGRDLGIARLLEALDPLVSEHFALQWAPGRAHSEDDGPVGWLKWFWWRAHGAWVRLPHFAGRPTLVSRLAEQIGQSLTAYETSGAGAALQVLTWSIPPGGEARIEDIVDAGDWPASDALLMVMGTHEVDVTTEVEHGLYPLLPADPGAAQPGPAEPAAAGAELDGARLGRSLELCLERRACCIHRYGPELYVFEAAAAGAGTSIETCQEVMYLDLATGQALIKAAADAGRAIPVRTLAGLVDLADLS